MPQKKVSPMEVPHGLVQVARAFDKKQQLLAGEIRRTTPFTGDGCLKKTQKHRFIFFWVGNSSPIIYMNHVRTALCCVHCFDQLSAVYTWIMYIILSELINIDRFGKMKCKSYDFTILQEVHVWLVSLNHIFRSTKMFHHRFHFHFRPSGSETTVV